MSACKKLQISIKGVHLPPNVPSSLDWVETYNCLANEVSARLGLFGVSAE